MLLLCLLGLSPWAPGADSDKSWRLLLSAVRREVHQHRPRFPPLVQQQVLVPCLEPLG
jgi:hypothetical protein